MTAVSVEVRAIAAGLPAEGLVRVTVLLRPAARESTLASEMRDWPMLETMLTRPGAKPTDRRHFTLLAGPTEQACTNKVDGTLAWSPGNFGRRLNLWRRAMDPDGTNETFDSLKFALVAGLEGDRTQVATLPTPDGPAALSFTLERGRMAIDAIAEGHGPVLALASARDPAWTPPPVRLASRGGTTTDAPAGLLPDDDVTSRFRRAGAALALGLDPGPVWPHEDEIIQGALGRGGTLDPYIHDVTRLHAATTPPDAAVPSTGAAPGGDAPDVVTARLSRVHETAMRRLGSVLAQPVLQRMFGFALDLQVPVDDLRRWADPNGFVVLAVEGHGGIKTLARLAPPGSGSRGLAGFAPANWTDLDPASVPAPFRDLGRPASMLGGKRYALCTVDYAMAAEAELTRQNVATGDKSAANANDPCTPDTQPNGAVAPAPAPAPSTAMPTLRNGGLRLVDLDLLCAVCKRPDPVSPTLHQAEQLANADRLMVGLRTGASFDAAHGGKGVEWRCPQWRVVTYGDPGAADHWRGLNLPRAEAPAWFEQEIVGRLGPADGPRRLELDAGSLHPATLECPKDQATPPPGSAASKNERVLFSTVAAWGGEPMGPGATGVGKPMGGRFEWSACVVDDLDITRRFAPVTRRNLPQAGRDALSPMLRFGWAYHVALARVFDGGGCASLVDVSPAAERAPGIALPTLVDDRDQEGSGKRFLRHERVDPPMVLFPAAEWARLPSGAEKQRGADMVVRTRLQPGTGPEIRSTRRLLAAPPVPLHFASLHDVLRGLRSLQPPTGLPGLVVLPAEPGHKIPARVQVGKAAMRSASPYYPDPAASLMVIGLFALGFDGKPGEALDMVDPLVIPIDAPWPYTRPVDVELVADTSTANGRAPRLEHLGRRGLVPGEALSADRGVPVEAVRIHLPAGLDVFVQAWCIPTARQVATWFDVVESALVLATAIGQETAGGTDSVMDACSRGLDAIFGTGAAPACAKTTSFEDKEGSRDRLAGLLHARMQRAPLAFLAASLAFRVTHATGIVAPATVGDRPLMVTRRTFPAKDRNGLAWFTGVPRDAWGEASTEPNATGVLFGGAVRYDPATTGAIEVHVRAANPFGQPLDGQRGRPEADRMKPRPAAIGTSDALYGFTVDGSDRVAFVRRTAPALRLDFLPPPADGRTGARSFDLEALQADAWATVKRAGQAIRASLPSVLTSPGARRLEVSLVASTRHPTLLECAKDTPKTEETVLATLWLPATIRPAPPLVDHLQLGFHRARLRPLALPGRQTVGIMRRTSVRVWLQRPWFSAGEGERLGVVLWPPGLNVRGTQSDEAGMAIVVAIEDEDLGPGGAFVTRWGADPIERPRPGVVAPALLRATDVKGDMAALVPRAYMPIPAEGSEVPTESVAPAPAPAAPSAAVAPPAPDASACPPAMAPAPAPAVPAPPVAEPPVTPTRTMAVALLTFEPRFDPLSEHWYVDLVLETDPLPMPRVRLGLVRYQPHAREDEVAPEGEAAVRLRVSTPVAEWIQPLPARRAEASWSEDGAHTVVQVTILGASAAAVTPGSGGEGADTVMSVALLRHRRGSGAADSVAPEQPVLDDAGADLVCDEWNKRDGKGTMQPDRALVVWSCTLRFRGRVGADGWQHAVVIRETRRLKAAADGGGTQESPLYLERLELDTTLEREPT